MSLSKTPKQTAHAAKDLSLVRGMTNKLLKGNAIVVEQQETQPQSKDDHNDIGGGDVGDVAEMSEEDMDKLKGLLSDDGDENEGMNVDDDDDEVVDDDDDSAADDEEVDDSAADDDDDDDDDDENFSFFQLIFGKNVMIAIGLMMAIGDLAHVKEDRVTDVKEMYQLALRYLFGELTDDEKLEIDSWGVGINVFTDFELETMKKAEICSTDDWIEIIKPENFLNILQTKLMASGKHTTVFLKMQNRVKSVAEAFATAKDSSSAPTIDDYFHSKATGKKEVETRLNKNLLSYLKQQAEDTDLCVIKDQRSATVADSIFTVIANMFNTTVKDFNSMDLLGSNGRKALNELLSDVTEQKVKSRLGAIYQGLKNWRKEGKGILCAAKNLFDSMDSEQQELVMQKIKHATELKPMKSYMFTKGKQSKHYGPNGKGKLMDCSKLFQKSNTDYLVMSKNAGREKDKNSAFLALPDDGFAVDADVLKVLQKHHKHQLKASPEAQLAYMQSVLELFEKFNCSSAQLTDGILTLFRDAMVQLQECADKGRAVREQTRRMAKKKASTSRIEDGGNNSDSESVDSNITTTTTGTPSGSPERKKQKKSDSD